MPAVKIPWWNTQKNQLEYATLPAKTFHVVGTIQTDSNTTLTTPVSHQEDNLPKAASAQDIQTPQTSTAPWQLLPWSIASLMTVLWLITLGFFLHSRKQRSHDSSSKDRLTPQKDEQKLKLAQILTSIKRDLENRHFSIAAKQIITYSAQKLKIESIYSLNDLLTHAQMHETLRDQLLSLERALYALDDNAAFDTTACIKAIDSYLPLIVHVKNDNNDVPLWEGLHPR